MSRKCSNYRENVIFATCVQELKQSFESWKCEIRGKEEKCTCVEDGHMDWVLNMMCMVHNEKCII